MSLESSTEEVKIGKSLELVGWPASVNQKPQGQRESLTQNNKVESNWEDSQCQSTSGPHIHIYTKHTNEKNNLPNVCIILYIYMCVCVCIMYMHDSSINNY